MKQTYSALALGLGLVLSVILAVFGSPNGGAEPSLPLLTSLLLCEVGFIVTAIAVALGVHQTIRTRRWSWQLGLMLGNLLVAINLARVALALWPQTGAS